jgi:CheY-like chemotaxis protein
MSAISNSSQTSVVILVAEDDMLIRMMAVDALADAGFAVIEASHAEGALDVLSAQANEIGALFTDINMPGTMNGLELAHHVRGCWPWIGLLVASGNAAPTGADLPAGSRFLRKPYNPLHVVMHIRELTCDG